MKVDTGEVSTGYNICNSFGLVVRAVAGGGWTVMSAREGYSARTMAGGEQGRENNKYVCFFTTRF